MSDPMISLRPSVRTFFRTLLPVAVLLLFLGASGVRPQASSAQTGQDELVLLVKNVKSGEGFSGDFVQTLGAPGTAGTRSEGSLVYRAPGLMILHYSNPPGQWLKLEGNRMALYVPQNRQVLLKTIRKHRIPETPAILLASIPEITKWFFVRPEGTGSERKGDKVSIVLIPRHPDPHLAQARLTLLKGEGILTDLLFMEQNGTHLGIRLKKFRILSHVPTRDLVVTVPQGTTAAEVPGAF
ncbi:MAG: outer-membrane lipoprotein carrier protein [Leptospirillum sp. Group IV 'UBA BS']|jgi:Outer membrane lipoprotein-sorting protein|nr:MAG: outer-membrane lipoprotein carrier protein [Leptospirillum sp. Group IV 'UBA BS']